MRKESTSSQNAPTFTCVVCSKESELVAVGSCDHRRVCSYCAMKSRLHYDYKKCPICLKILDLIFICEFSDKTPFVNLLKKKKEFYEDEEFDKCQIYYTTIEGKEEALHLRGFNCPLRSCKAETFENMNSLSEHLNKVHKRYYCPYCLKENKLFLSQMNIYNQKNLEDHIKYGEYEKNVMISPPHPSCPFDSTTFFNDEKMFTHMNTFHFICQLCRDKKNIIFYPELKNLLEHYKDNHYCCPFEECLADVYVVFGKEEELLSHLITKHKVENANERLNKLVFDRKNSDPKELHHEIGEFNFTEYINKIKSESEKFKNSNQNRFVHLNEQYLNDEGIEVEYQYTDNRYNNYYNKKYNNYGNYNNNHGYNKWNKFERNENNNRGRGKKNKRGNKRDYYNKYYNNEYYQNNYKNNYYYNNEEYNYEQQNYYEKNNYNEIENEVKEENSTNKIYENKNSEHTYNKGKHYNNHKERDHYNKNKYNKDIDYSFLFSFYLDLIKKFIKEKIISEKINEKSVKLPKETIYQIIIMIDKFDTKDQLLELTYLNNFGIDLNIHKELKSIISSSSEENEQHFKNILKNLELKKLLIIYKYLYKYKKKVDNLFYRLDFEQIDEDLYEDFVQKEKKVEENMSKIERDKRNRHIQLKQELDMGPKLLPEDKKVTEMNFNKPKKQQEKKEDKKKEESPKNKPKTKISMLLNNELDEKKEDNKNNKTKGKKKKGKYVEFNINDFDLDKDFPKLK